MNTIKHHPSDALLVDYASGAMGPAQTMVIAAHVHACPRCRDQVTAAEAMGGALLDSLPDAGLSAGALDRALARLELSAPEPSPTAWAPAPQPADWIKVPTEVAVAATRKRWLAPGVWMAPVDAGTSGGPLSYLLRVGARLRMPVHTHRGSELTLVLKGAFRDGRDTFGAGDLAEADDSVEHSPAILGREECVCLVACDNRLVVKEWLGKVVQTYAGI
jgi:putative transcriptional regulator